MIAAGIQCGGDLESIDDTAGRTADAAFLDAERRTICRQRPAGLHRRWCLDDDGLDDAEVSDRGVRAGVGAVEGACSPEVGIAWAECLRESYMTFVPAAFGRDPIRLMQDGLEVCVGRDVHLHPERSRTPDVVALPSTNVVGAPVVSISAPMLGSIGAGAVISTPGIGPATSGLSGFALLARVQPVTPTRATSTSVRMSRVCIMGAACGSLSALGARHFTGLPRCA